MAELSYNRGKARMAQVYFGGAAAPSGFGVLLLSATVAAARNPDLNTVADLLAVAGVAEVVGGAYARQNLAAITVTEDDANDRANVDAGDVAFGAVAGVSAVAAVLFEQGANDGARHLISYHDTGFPKPLDGGLNLQIADFFRVL